MRIPLFFRVLLVSILRTLVGFASVDSLEGGHRAPPTMTSLMTVASTDQQGFARMYLSFLSLKLKA